LDSVLSDLMGQSGRAMIEALIAGETSPAKLASLANRRVKASHEELREALRGRVTNKHRFHSGGSMDAACLFVAAPRADSAGQ
jgi:transposase